MRSNLVSVSASLACLAFAAPAPAEPRPSQPNILLITTDDENPELIESYGGAVYTPHIDSLARNGVRFTNANVVHSVCSPSRYAILTGRYYSHSRGAEYLNAYPPGTPSSINNFITFEGDGFNLQSVLRQHGYFTAHIGKYHLADHRLLRTTEEWERAGLLLYPADADPRKDPGINARMKANHEWWRERIKKDGFDFTDAVYSANLREFFNQYLHAHNVEWTTDAAVRFIRSRQDGKKPFYLSVNTTYPHSPRPESRRDGRHPFSIDADVQLTGEGFVVDRDLSAVLKGESRESVRRFLDRSDFSEHAAFATWWDAGVGAILDALREIGQYENTIVIYISDHGVRNNGKTTLYETGVRVPLIIQWPARFARGHAYHRVVGSIDIVPTLFDVLRIRPPAGYLTNGISLLPALQGGNEPVREGLLLVMGYAHGIKTDRWKYIAVRYPEPIERMLSRGETDPRWTHSGWEQPRQPYLMDHFLLASQAAKSNPHYFARNQLFDLEADPEEKHNLFDVSPAESAHMKTLLGRALREHIPDRPFGEFHRCDDPEIYRNVSGAVWHPRK